MTKTSHAAAQLPFHPFSSQPPVPDWVKSLLHINHIAQLSLVSLCTSYSAYIPRLFTVTNPLALLYSNRMIADPAASTASVAAIATTATVQALSDLLQPVVHVHVVRALPS